MSLPDDTWNPEDGEPPTVEERQQVATFERAMTQRIEPPTGVSVLAVRRPTGDMLIDVALRVRATVRAPADTERVVERAIADAVQSASPRWYRSRWRWIAMAASLVFATGSVGMLAQGPRLAELPSEVVSRGAADVFTQPVDVLARSAPIEKLTSSRWRSYRTSLTSTRSW